MPRCATCGLEYADELTECPGCATEESGEVVRCERCGASYDSGDSCPICGALHTKVQCETHPERVALARCVVCGRALCAECGGEERRGALCEAHRNVALIEGWAQVYSPNTEIEAQLLRENLRAEGISAQIYSQRDNIFSVDLGELSIIRLMVPVWEYEHAQEVMRDHMDTEGDVAFACPECGEAYELGSRECASCGAALT